MTLWWLPDTPTIQEKRLSMIKQLEEQKTWSSDIPDELLHSMSENHEYKVRKGRFGWIVHRTEVIFNQILVDKKYEPTRKELMTTLRDFCNDEFRGRKTTKEDIEKGDVIIDRLIKILQDTE